MQPVEGFDFLFWRQSKMSKENSCQFRVENVQKHRAPSAVNREGGRGKSVMVFTVGD